MNGRLSKHIRREFKKHWKSDIDQLLDDLAGLSLKYRIKFCWQVLFKRRVKA